MNSSRSSNHNKTNSNKMIPHQQQELPFIIEDPGQGSFIIHVGGTTCWKAELLNNLKVLREANYTKKLHMYILKSNEIHSCAMTEEVAQSLEDTFFHYLSLRRRTKKWSIALVRCCEDCPNCHKVLQVVCKSELFESLSINGMRTKMTHKTAFTLRHAMINNKSLKKLDIIGMSMCEETAFVFSDGLKETSCLEEIFIRRDITDANRWELFDSNNMYEGHTQLVQGLKENRTLKSFFMMLTNLPDAILASAVAALRGHSALEQLDLFENQCGQLTIKELQHVLLNSSNLTSLSLCRNDDFDSQTIMRLNVDALVSGLKTSDSIQKLCLTGYYLNHSSLDKLFEGLSRCPVLEHLDIGCCDISVDLATICLVMSKCHQLKHVNMSRNSIYMGSCRVSYQRPTLKMSTTSIKEPQLRCLNLKFNPITEDNGSEKKGWGDLVQMLQANPYLRSFGHENEEEVFPSQIVNLLDMNRFRVVFNLFRDENFPLSCWPHALEKVCNTPNCAPARRTSIIYHLLVQGLATYRFAKTSKIVARKSFHSSTYSQDESSMKQQKVEKIHSE